MTACEAGQNRLIVQRKTKTSRRGRFFETDFYFYPLSKEEKEYMRRGNTFSLGLALPVYGKSKLNWDHSQLGEVVLQLVENICSLHSSLQK